MKHNISKRLLALLLCMAMLLPYLDALPLRAWATTEEIGSHVEEPSAIVYAGSDFQYLNTAYNGVTYDDVYAANAVVMKEILTRIKLDYPTMDEAFLLGDYSNNYDATAANAGIAAVNGVLKEVWGLDYDRTLFVQGNHDASGNLSGVTNMDATGAHDSEHYGVYQINHDDFSWGQSSSSGKAAVQATADGLKAYLDQKIQADYKKPIFVITHLPLHHTWRGDNLWAELLVDVLNEAGKAGLNIIFMYGHNHSGPYDNYIGGDCVYLQPGDELVVTDCEQYASGMDQAARLNMYESVELEFTYMNSGYLGYSNGDLTSTIFEIYGDRVEIARYSKNGPVDLRKAGAKTSSDGDWPAVTTAVSSPQTLSLSNVVPFVISNTLGDVLYKEKTAAIQIGVKPDVPYTVTWSSSDEGVATAVADPSDPTKVTITGVDYGAATVKVTVQDSTDSTAIPATMYFEVTVLPNNAVALNDGADTMLYQLVTDWSTITAGKDYMILASDQMGVTKALAGPTPEREDKNQDPSAYLTEPKVFQVPGKEGIYTTSVNGYDLWQFTLNDDGTAYRVGRVNTRSNFLAANAKIDSQLSYSQESWFRFCSSYTSDGIAWWTLDAENRMLDLHSYYEDSTKEIRTPTEDYTLSYNHSSESFQLRGESDTTGTGFYIFEATSEKAPQMWMWLTADSGSIIMNGDEVTGAKVAIMVDGQITEIPITVDMLTKAYTEVPGVRTCSVSCYGEVISDQFQITVTGEEGTIITPVTLLKNNGDLYKLVTSGSLVGGKQYMIVPGTTVGESYALSAAQNQNGSYDIAARPVNIVVAKGGSVYVQAQDQSVVWNASTSDVTDKNGVTHTKDSAGYSFMCNDLYGVYLNGTRSGTVYTIKLLEAEELPASSLGWRLSGTYDCRITTASSTYIGIQAVNDNFIGASISNANTSYVYVKDPDASLDEITAYVRDQSGTIQAGSMGALSTGETITVTTYYTDGTYTTEEIPVTTDMLNISPVERCVPGNYLCQVTYNGKVVCENFLLTVTSSAGDPADKPVELTKNWKLFKRITSAAEFAAGSTYVLVDTDTQEAANVMTALQNEEGYEVAVAYSAVLDIGDSQYVMVKDDSWLWTTATHTQGLSLRNNVSGKYLGGTTNYELVLRDAPSSTYGWRYSASRFNVDTTSTSVPEGATYAKPCDIAFSDGRFYLVVNDSSPDTVLVYPYKQYNTAQTMVIYPDSLEGQCVTDSTDTTTVGGNLVLTTIIDGVTDQRQIPITLDMLNLSDWQRVVPGTYTCTLSYEGQVLSTKYQITILPKEGEKPAASQPVVLIEEGDKVFRLYVNSSDWVDGGENMFVTDVSGEVQVVGMTPDGQGGYIASVHSGETFTVANDGNTYIVAEADDQIWNPQKTIQTDNGSVSTALGQRFYVKNSVYGNYLFVTEDYELIFADANTAGTNTNGWRVSSNGLVTGTDGSQYPYADLVPRGPRFVARYRKVTSGNSTATAKVYVRDRNLVSSFAYLDQLSGTSSVDSTESYACGGSVTIKTVLADSSVVTDTVPITMDMLQLSYEEKHTPGTYTCEVVYRGKVLCEDYQLTVIDDQPLPQADKPVVVFDSSRPVFKRVTKLSMDQTYVFVDSREQGKASVMTHGTDGIFPAEDVVVFAIDGRTSQYVTVEDSSWLWKTDYMYNASETAIVYPLYASDTGMYLHVNEQLQLVMVDRKDAVSENSGWHNAGANWALGNGSSGETPYITVKNLNGVFQAVDRYVDATDTNAAYIYERDNTLEGQVAYVTSLAGSCPAGSSYDLPLGGSVVVKTYHTDGTVTTQEIPIDLSMLDGIDPLDLYVAGERTCSVVYQGQVLTDNYVLTISGGDTAASTPVKLADENSLIFKRTTALTAGKQYVLVNRKTDGTGRALGVTMDGDVFVLDDPNAAVTDDGINTIVIAKSEAWIWDAVAREAGQVYLYNETADQYLLAASATSLKLGPNYVTSYGWRLSTDENLGINTDAYYTDVVNNGEGFYMQRRNTEDSTGHTYAYQRDDTITMVLGYMDSLTGEVHVGQTGTVLPGGHVIVQTFYDNGKSGRAAVPVTLDMLDLTLTQLNTPGEYTTTVTYDGKVITDAYVLTVTGEQPDGMLEIPGEEQTVRGYVAVLDGIVSDELPVGSGGRIPTGNTLKLYTYYPDGTVELTEVVVTLDMLNITAQQLNVPGTYDGLTLTYKKLQITDNYTVRLSETVQDDYPDFPNEGSVKVDKQVDTTKFNTLQTGSAQINLSLAGIPTTSKANVVVVLDASSSMLACTHGVYQNTDITDAQRGIFDKAFAMNQTLTAAEISFLQSLDWSGYGAADVAKNQTRMQAVIDRTITSSEFIALQKSMRMYGMCYDDNTDTYKWVGDGDEHCKRRSQITKEALVELLEFLQQDMDGYDMDIDVAVAYFNQLYAIDPDLIFLNDEPAIVSPRSDEELMLAFTNSKEVVIEDVVARYKTLSGTNYDRGMEWIYQLLSEKQTADYQEYLAGDTSQPYRARQDFVLFMSDGDPGQFNYMLTNNAPEFTNFYNGTIKENEMDKYVSEENLPAFREMYNPEGKLWLAEAIKGEKTEKYKVIDPTMPETNYVNYVSGLGATMMTVTLNAYAPVMHRIASSEDYYIPTETADDIQQAFGAFGSLITSGSGASFKDQMGSEFDLQTSNAIDVQNVRDMYMPGSNSWETFTGGQNMRSVYFDAYDSGWSRVHIHAWNNSGNYTGEWPGAEMTHLGNGVFVYQIPENVTNVVFKDGGSTAQSANLTIPAGDSLYRSKDGTWHSYSTRTIYFDASGCSWSGIKAYTWGGIGISTTGAWPGANMIHLGGSIYSCEIPADATGIKFSNAANENNQTGDLTPPSGGKNLYRFKTNGWDTYATRTVYFNNAGKNWDAVYAYTWDENGDYTTSAWHGMPMTHIGGGIYSCEIPADAVEMNFNDGVNQQTDNLTVPPTQIRLDSSITVSKYELYKYSEHLQNPQAVTMDMVGKRKDTEPTVLEKITFSDDGTKAYSNLVDGGKTNILIDGVICAQNFWYNTSTGSSVMIDVDGNGTPETLLESETFYWTVDSVPEDELVLSYNVYLTGTLEGTRGEGSYATNNYATLHYTNHLGNDCELDTTSPMLPWNQAVVGYGFYLVDADGNPIVNEDQHLTGSFEKAIRMTQPQYIDLLYNSAENVEPWELKASDVLPEGYSLYDPTAAYHVALYADGNGSWQVTGSSSKLTTYITGYGGVATTQAYATAGMSGSGQTYDYPAYATAATVVWFAVRADVNAVPDTVVIDYGISVDIHVLGNDVVITDQNSVIAGIGSVSPEDTDSNGVIFTSALAEGYTATYEGSFGTATVRGNAIRYTPNTLQMTAEETFFYGANYQGSKNSGHYYASVTVIPATSIYFEDNFVTFDDNWVQVGQTVNGVVQDEDRLGSFSLPQIDANNVYGYDSAYANMETYSMGSAMKATVNVANPEAIAEFTFTGTGFDIISFTGTDTGMVLLTVEGITDPSISRYLMVDTYYSMSDGLYQVPIMKLQDLPYGTYWVELYVGYGSSFDHLNGGSYEFYLDAIRIYDTTNDGEGNKLLQDAYVSDNEGWPSYQELRNLLITMNTFDSLGKEDEVEGVIFIDGNSALGESAIADYISNGPNNELYLAPGQAIAFNLNVDATDENVAGIHLGLKSVGGTAIAKVYNASLNHSAVKEQRLSSASQQYFDISGLDGHTVVIWNVGGEGDAILSVTDLKTTYENPPRNTGRSSLTINRSSAQLALASMGAAVQEQPIPVLSPKYPTLSFESEVVYNVYFAAENLGDVQPDGMGLAIFDSTGAALLSEVPGAERAGELYMVHTAGIPAKTLGDKVYFKVYAKLADGSYVYSNLYSYSAVDYAKNTLETPGSEAQKALVVAMLNYGAAAQEYFGYRTDSLMNSWLTDEQKALCGDYREGLVSTPIRPDSEKLASELTDITGGFTSGQPTVTFGDRFTINYYFTPANTVDGTMTLYYWDLDTYMEAQQLTFENATAVTMELQPDGSYLASGTPIAAKELDDTVFALGVYEDDGVRYGTGVLTYSVAKYCLGSAGGSGIRSELARATVVYGSLAADYFSGV